MTDDKGDDPFRASLSGELLEQYDQVMKMPPSSIRDDLVAKIKAMATGSYEYFDWDGRAVRVAAAGGACEVFTNGAWSTGGPSYTVRQEECTPLSSEQFERRFPDAAAAG